MKQCSKCKSIKPTSEFTPRVERSGQFTSDCKKCRAEKIKYSRKINREKFLKTERAYRARNRKILNQKNKMVLREKRKKDKNFDRAYKLKYTYGITIEEFDRMLKKQGGGCAICKTKEPGGRGFGVDHDHKTKKIRGILCHSCNTSLGGFKDSPDLLKKAIKYLTKT